MFHKRPAARPENTIPAASQRKKESSKYFNMSAALLRLFLEGLSSFAICIHGVLRSLATTFVKYAGRDPFLHMLLSENSSWGGVVSCCLHGFFMSATRKCTSSTPLVKEKENSVC